MNRLLIIPFAAFAVVSSGVAQGVSATGSPPTQVEVKRPNRMAIEKEVLSKLNLNVSQKDQVTQALETYTKGLKELRKEKSPAAKAEMKEKHKALQTAYMSSLKSILTLAQMEQYKLIHKEMRKKMEEEKATPPKPL